MAWGIVYFKTKDGKAPAEDFLDACPAKIEARFHAVLEAVRDAPPPQFSGGGYWEAMHGDMGGFHGIVAKPFPYFANSARHTCPGTPLEWAS